jgi:hypothetical protein
MSENVRQFIAEMLVLPMNRIMDERRIRTDYGCDGDDAVELLTQFAKKFEVDMKNYNHDDFFYPEWALSFLSPAVIFKWFTGTLPRPKYEIRVKDLIHVATIKRWERSLT